MQGDTPFSFFLFFSFFLRLSFFATLSPPLGNAGVLGPGSGDPGVAFGPLPSWLDQPAQSTWRGWIRDQGSGIIGRLACRPSSLAPLLSLSVSRFTVWGREKRRRGDVSSISRKSYRGTFRTCRPRVVSPCYLIISGMNYNIIILNIKYLVIPSLMLIH